MMRYEVDAAMLGQDFDGGRGGVRDFCEILQAYVGSRVEIVAVTDAHNGATSGQSQYDAEAAIGDAWDAAIMAYYAGLE